MGFFINIIIIIVVVVVLNSCYIPNVTNGLWATIIASLKTCPVNGRCHVNHHNQGKKQFWIINVKSIHIPKNDE